MIRMKLAALAAFAALAAPAWAAQIDFDAAITDLDGKPEMLDGGRTMTLRIASEVALLSNFPDEPALATEAKSERFWLAERIHRPGAADLSAEEVALLKRLIGKAYPPLVVGRAIQLLDPKK
jgi:hypothetical protein